MEVKHWTDEGGVVWREIVCSDQKRLFELKSEYEKKGMSGTILPFDGEGKWMLTIRET